MFSTMLWFNVWLDVPESTGTGMEAAVARDSGATIVARREGDPPILVASIQRAADVLEWRPVHSSLDEMIGSAWAFRNGASPAIGA